MTDLTKIDVSFGELDIETKLALHRACYEGKMIEISFRGTPFYATPEPFWNSNCIYRVRPEPLRDIRLPWEVLDKKWQWAARDRDGYVCLFDGIPYIPLGEDYWNSGGQNRYIDDLFADFDPGNKPWDQSLIKRPEGV